jgi:hypothetical protein
MGITKKTKNLDSDDEEEENWNNQNQNHLIVTSEMIRNIDFDGLNNDTDPTYENREVIFKEMLLRKNLMVENVIGDGVYFIFKFIYYHRTVYLELFVNFCFITKVQLKVSI